MSSRRPGHRRRGRQSKGGSWFRSIDAWQWGLACSGWLTMLGMVGLPPGLPLRTVLVFGFVLLCPGLAIAGLIPVRDPLERWTIGVASSMAAALLVSLVFTLLRADSVMPRIGTLALLTTLAVLAGPVVARFAGERPVGREGRLPQ